MVAFLWPLFHGFHGEQFHRCNMKDLTDTFYLSFKACSSHMHFPYLQHRKMKNGWLLWHYSLHKTDPKKVYGCTGPFLQRYFWKPPICHQFSPFHNQNSKPTKAKFIPGSDFHYGWSWKDKQFFIEPSWVKIGKPSPPPYINFSPLLEVFQT